jgi:uroporphyrinogen-III synthase
VTGAAAPLAGRRLLLTRPDDATGLADRLRALGAAVVHVPATRVMPDPDGIAVARAAYAQSDWVLWTSARAVALLLADGVPAGAPRAAAVGPATADALRASGIAPVLVAEQADQDGLLAALRAAGSLAGARVLFPAAAGARATLEEGLRADGAIVQRVPCYASAADPEAATALAEARARGGIDLVLLTSPSTAQAWAAALGPAAAMLPAASIGPQTSVACRAIGIPVAVEARPSTADGLLEGLVAWARGDSGPAAH